MAFGRLTIREYPNIDEPVVTVATAYKGASAAIIESQITRPLEEALGGIEGIEVMSSISRQESSQITLRFKVSRDPNAAAADVRDRVGRARGQLPQEADEPVVTKVEADAQPILYLAFSSDSHNPMQITDYADRHVKDRLQNLSGVAEVRIFGERKMAMRIWLDPAKLAAFGLAPSEVENAIRKQNVEIPGGRIEGKEREFTVLADTGLKTPEEFGNIIIRESGGGFVRIKDIGRAEIAPVDERSVVRFNSRPAIALGVVKQATANPLEVSKAVEKALPAIRAASPKGMEIKVAYDSSVFIDRSIKEVYSAIMEAVALVVMVIFFFLRNFRSTMIPLVTIPVSLIGSFTIMYALGFSVNTLTLLSMVLAVGLVVDDAIVVLENVHRHVEMGKKPFQAAIDGSREIGFAIVAMTITLASVYAPVAFMSGSTGKLFTEFAITLSGAVIISGFVALTLSPMMCSLLLKREEKHGSAYEKVEGAINRFREGYEKKLDMALSRKGAVLAIGGMVAIIGVAAALLMKSELAPLEDRGTIVGVAIAPEGVTVNYTAEWMKKLEDVYRTVPDIEKYFVVAGFPVVNQGISFIRLKEWEQRSVKQQQVVQSLMPFMFGMPGIMAFPINPPSLGRNARSRQVEFIIKTSGSYEELEKITGDIMGAAMKSGILMMPDSDLKLNKPELKVTVDRDKAAFSGVAVGDIGRTLETMLGGRRVTRFERDGRQYDVITQNDDSKRANPGDIGDIYVPGKDGAMIKLSNLVTVREGMAPRELNHFGQTRAVKISADVAAGKTLGEALDFLNAQAREILPSHMATDLDGESREFRDSSSGMTLTFVLGVLFIYLVLAAQFESFRYPLFIMLTVPLSATGALLLLAAIGGTINIYTQVGLITLVGLITKHGILIVEFTGQLRERGMKTREALETACSQRLRPILMTTGAMALGALPLLMASGAGAESRSQIGAVIVGGMLVGTAFTLFVIPAVYLLVVGEENQQEGG